MRGLFSNNGSGLFGDNSANDNQNPTFESITLTTGIVGVTDGSAAEAGYVGYEVSTIVDEPDAVSLTTDTVEPVMSLFIPAGSWIINASLTFQGTSPVLAALEAFLSNAPGTSTSGQVTDNTDYANAISTFRVSTTIVGFKLDISEATTIYLKGKATFTPGSVEAFGFIKAIVYR